MWTLKNYLLGCFFLSISSVGMSKIQDSFIYITAHKQSTDRDAPWKQKPIHSQNFIGTIIKIGNKNYALTTAYSVADTKRLEFQGFSKYQKEELEVFFIDYEINLALLYSEKLQKLPSIPLSETLPLEKEVTYYSSQSSTQLNKNNSQVNQVVVIPAQTSRYFSSAYKIPSSGKHLGWGEPVIVEQDGKQFLAGLLIHKSGDFAYAVTTNVIKHFRDDLHNEDYRGFISLGIQFQYATSESMRHYLNLSPKQGGIRVAKVLNQSSFKDIVQEDDVIMKINDLSISTLGKTQHPKWQEVDFRTLIMDIYAGDIIEMQIYRKGKLLNVKAKVSQVDSNAYTVRSYRYNSGEPYLIFAGFIFQELSLDYLKTWGNEWPRKAPSLLLWEWDVKNNHQLAGERVVIVNRVLATPENLGYHHISSDILKKVNGRPITSLDALKQALNHPTQQEQSNYSLLEFFNSGEVVLSHNNLAAMHQRIQLSYGIKDSAYFILPRN